MKTTDRKGSTQRHLRHKGSKGHRKGSGKSKGKGKGRGKPTAKGHGRIRDIQTQQQGDPATEYDDQDDYEDYEQYEEYTDFLEDNRHDPTEGMPTDQPQF